MFLARMVFFRLHESPRYLVHAGRPEDAVKALQLISRFNGSDISIGLEDVRDTPVTAEEDFSKCDVRSRANSITAFSVNIIPDETTSIARYSGLSTEDSQLSRSVFITHYASTGETPSLDSRGDSTPASDLPTKLMLKDVTTAAGESLPQNNRGESATSRRLSVCKPIIWRALPKWLRRSLWGWWDRVMMMLTPEWLETTILVWLVWFGMSLGSLI